MKRIAARLFHVEHGTPRIRTDTPSFFEFRSLVTRPYCPYAKKLSCSIDHGGPAAVEASGQLGANTFRKQSGPGCLFSHTHHPVRRLPDKVSLANDYSRNPVGLFHVERPPAHGFRLTLPGCQRKPHSIHMERQPDHIAVQPSRSKLVGTPLKMGAWSWGTAMGWRSPPCKLNALSDALAP